MPSRKRSFRKKFVVFLLAIVVALLLSAAAAALWFRSAATASLPQVSGETAVAGLSAAVEVLRDERGVPHITAATIDDLVFAQGFVTAQDRLWQMDLARRYAAGEMAEVLGERYLRHDIQQRTLLMRAAAERAASEVSERDRRFLEAYARGVNAFIEASQDQLPVEFRVLRYAPEPWTPVDSLLVGANMVQLLTFEAVQHSLLRERVVQQLGPQSAEAQELYPNSSWRDIPPQAAAPAQSFDEPDPEVIEEYGAGEEEQPKARPRRRKRRTRAAEKGLERSFRAGSNNWVVASSRTETGKPLLANDMHLPHQVPSLWYQAHLTSGDFDVAGVTLPGVPFVISGQNRRIAWGFTNIGPAVHDIYVEQFHQDGTYATPQGPQRPEVRRESIRVRRSLVLGGTREVPLEITVTRHGPVITPLLDGERRTLALRWTVYESGGLTFPFYEVNAARNWDEFRRAFSTFANPGQNVVYADVDGNIGYQATGRVPLREGWTGALPVPGHVADFDWRGWIPYEQMPSVYNPPSGLIATANARITTDEYPHTISNEWDASYRTERIYRVLARGGKLNPRAMSELQNDAYSAFDHFLAERLAYATDRIAKSNDRAKQAADILRDWDGRVTADSAAPTIVSYARRELTRMLLEPKLGQGWRNYRWMMSEVWLENTLLRTPAHWLPSGHESYEAVLAAALERAATHDDAPRDLKSWRWGEQIAVKLSHPLFGAVPLLGASTGERPQSGNGTTVKQVGSGFGPSDRFVADMADLDRSTLNIVGGQSGHVMSENFLDQFPVWLEGGTLPLRFSRAAVESAARHKLTLRPR